MPLASGSWVELFIRVLRDELTHMRDLALRYLWTFTIFIISVLERRSNESYLGLN